jgi:succinate dehydrogenase / fumarate reductase cytochrome b subunit
MLVSILHRATGTGMALVGLPLFAWWLVAAAGGEESYARFLSWFTGDWRVLGYVLAVGLSFAFFQHMASGIRHFFMDVGALFELKVNKTSAVATLLTSAVLTVAFWAVLLGAVK